MVRKDRLNKADCTGFSPLLYQKGVASRSKRQLDGHELARAFLASYISGEDS